MADSPTTPQSQSEQVADIEDAIDAATQAVSIQANDVSELSHADPRGNPMGLAPLLDVRVQVTVVVGNARVSLADLVQLRPGSLVSLDRQAHEPADILASGKVIARGEVVTIDGAYGVRITELLGKG